MTTEKPKAEFVLGSEVSPSQFFKSTFARKFVTNCHDYNSLDYEILADTNTEQDNNDSRNNNFFSMNNFTDKSVNEKDVTYTVDSSKLQKPAANHPNARELEALRKLCQSLEEENQKLKSASLQNVHLQTQIDTLQWQVKQVESNRQMYRSVMLQVAHFLDRTRKSLDILHNKSNAKDKGGRVPRSRSVHADSSLSRGPSTSSSSSASSGTRAKSATRTSNTGFREFTRSILRKNDHSARSPQSPIKLLPDANKIDSDIIYQEPKQTELNPDEVPPEKLSQEAFRLLRTVQSLLTMQGPDLAKIISNESGGSSPSPTSPSLLHNGNFINSTMLQQTPRAGSSNSDRVNELNGSQNDKSYCSKPSNGTTEIARNLQIFLSSTRNSYVDSTSPSLGSSKTEEENVNGFSINTNGIVSNEQTDRTLLSLASNTATKKLEKKVLSCNSKSPLGSIGNESGFCSISSFQEVGLPLPLPSIRGYHTEIGLPVVDNSRHRRWSSTPVEIQGLLKHHRASFNGSQVSAKSVSIWV